MKLIFDLDGTLIDSRRRLYQLFIELAPQSQLTESVYWNYKRNAVPNEEILRQTLSFEAAAIETFVARWMGLIETNQYLEFDSLFDYTLPTLTSLARDHELYLCTSRRNIKGAELQLTQLGLREYFKEVILAGHHKLKAEMILGRIPEIGHQDFIIGDTGEDILAARRVGCNACAVTSGFRNEEVLRTYAPDFLLGNISQLHNLL